MCQRHPGGGRKPDWQTQPRLRQALEALIEPSAPDSPTNPLQWACLNTRRLAQELRRQGLAASMTEIGLEVHAWLEENQYEKGRKVSDAELRMPDQKRPVSWRMEL